MNTEKFEAKTNVFVEKVPIIIHSFDDNLYNKLCKLEESSRNLIMFAGCGLISYLVFKNLEEIFKGISSYLNNDKKDNNNNDDEY